jgi:hypothetical protein
VHVYEEMFSGYCDDVLLLDIDEDTVRELYDILYS